MLIKRLPRSYELLHQGETWEFVSVPSALESLRGRVARFSNLGYRGPNKFEFQINNK